MDPRKTIKELRSLRGLGSLRLKFIQKGVMIVGLTMDHPCKKGNESMLGRKPERAV